MWFRETLASSSLQGSVRFCLIAVSNPLISHPPHLHTWDKQLRKINVPRHPSSGRPHTACESGIPGRKNVNHTVNHYEFLLGIMVSSPALWPTRRRYHSEAATELFWVSALSWKGLNSKDHDSKNMTLKILLSSLPGYWHKSHSEPPTHCHAN